MVKHSWANCSKNPANQKKPALQSIVNTHHAAIDNCYLSNNNRVKILCFSHCRYLKVPTTAKA